MGEFYGQFLQWINTHPEYACLATFIIATAESVAVIGTIIPGTVTMAAIGGLAGAGIIPLWLTLFLAMLGAVVGDGISYWIGYYLRDRLPTIWPFKTRPAIYAQAKYFVECHGGKSVFFGRFIGPIRALIPLVAGSFGMSPLRFTLANIFSAILWAPAYMLPGILLGALALELPPDIAVKLLGIGLIIIVTGGFLIWLAQFLGRISTPTAQKILQKIWHHCQYTFLGRTLRYCCKHHDQANYKSGQLGRALWLLLLLLSFILWSWYLAHTTLATLSYNDDIYRFFRIFHFKILDDIMIWINQFGELFVILPLALIVFIALVWRQQFRIALYWIVYILFSYGITLYLKRLFHFEPPWGIIQRQIIGCYPSLSLIMFSSFSFGLLALIGEHQHLFRRKLIFILFIILTGLMSFSSLYLGKHWFSDIIGSLLLSYMLAQIFIFTIKRHTTTAIFSYRIVLVLLAILALLLLLFAKQNVQTLRADFATIEWPAIQMNQNIWWNSNGDQIPLYQKNIHNDNQELITIQWLGNVMAIKQVLTQQGFSLIHTAAWDKLVDDLLHPELKHLPLLAPLYLDAEPALIMTRAYGSKDYLVVWLWDSHIIMKESGSTLWVGCLHLVPYGNQWIQHLHMQSMNPKLIFINPVVGWAEKTVPLRFALFESHEQAQKRILLLLKPLQF